MTTLTEKVVKKLKTKKGKDDTEISAQIGVEGLESEVSGFVSTQCPMLDYIIGQPGIPKGRLTTIVGQEGSGKSTLALHLLKETQKNGGIGVLADTEHRLWTDRASKIGIDFDNNFIFLRPETLEETMDGVEQVVMGIREEDPEIDVTIVVDSIAGAPTQADLSLKYGETLPASHARLIALALRRIHPLISRERVCLIFVNQLRYKIDFGRWGPPQMVMLAEKSINYHSSLKLYLEQSAKLGDVKSPTGIRVAATVLESRISPREGWKCTFDLDFRTGIDTFGSALDVLVVANAVTFAGGWYDFEGTKFRRGDFAKIVEKNPTLLEFVQVAPVMWQEEVMVAEEES